MKTLIILILTLQIWCLWAVFTYEKNMDYLRAELKKTQLITTKIAIDVIKIKGIANGTT